MAKVKQRLSLILILVLILSLAAAGIAIAQDKTAVQPRTGLKQLYLEKLAGVLGIDQNQLQADMKNAGQQALDAAAAEGLIDSTRATSLRKALDSGCWPWPAGPPGKVHFFRHRLDNALAAVLGMTPRQLYQELKNSKTLEQLAAAKGLTMEQLKTQLISNVKSQLDQAVAGGKLTREKADKILNRLEQLDLSKLLPHQRLQQQK